MPSSLLYAHKDSPWPGAFVASISALISEYSFPFEDLTFHVYLFTLLNKFSACSGSLIVGAVNSLASKSRYGPYSSSWTSLQSSYLIQNFSPGFTCFRCSPLIWWVCTYFPTSILPHCEATYSFPLVPFVHAVKSYSWIPKTSFG